MTIRLSMLDQARYCSAAPALSAQHGAGRAAAMSHAFHGILAGASAAEDEFRRLSEAERAELSTWHLPTSCEPAPGIELVYEAAEKELPVGLTPDGTHCPYDAPDRLTQGTLDFAWTARVNGVLVAYVADLKKSARPANAHPGSLQLAGYGFAYASLRQCDAFVPGIWYLEEGRWAWGDLVYLESAAGIDIWQTVKAAAENTSGQFATGPHCSDCYARLHCPEYTLPAVLAETDLRAFASGGELTGQGVARALLFAEALEDLAKKVKDSARECARRGLDIRSNGKRYVGIQGEGREYLNLGECRQKLGDAVEPLVRRSKPVETFRWVKA